MQSCRRQESVCLTAAKTATLWPSCLFYNSKLHNDKWLYDKDRLNPGRKNSGR